MIIKTTYYLAIVILSLMLSENTCANNRYHNLLDSTTVIVDTLIGKKRILIGGSSSVNYFRFLNKFPKYIKIPKVYLYAIIDNEASTIPAEDISEEIKGVYLYDKNKLFYHRYLMLGNHIIIALGHHDISTKLYVLNVKNQNNIFCINEQGLTNYEKYSLATNIGFVFSAKTNKFISINMSKNNNVYRTEFSLNRHKISKIKTVEFSLDTYKNDINLLLVAAKSYFVVK